MVVSTGCLPLSGQRAGELEREYLAMFEACQLVDNSPLDEDDSLGRFLLTAPGRSWEASYRGTPESGELRQIVHSESGYEDSVVRYDANRMEVLIIEQANDSLEARAYLVDRANPEQSTSWRFSWQRDD